MDLILLRLENEFSKRSDLATFIIKGLENVHGEKRFEGRNESALSLVIPAALWSNRNRGEDIFPFNPKSESIPKRPNERAFD